MSTLAALVILLLVLVGLLAVLGLGYAVHRRPALAAPVTVTVAGAAVLVAVVTIVVTAGRSTATLPPSCRANTAQLAEWHGPSGTLLP